MAANRPTIRDVAVRAGVSKGAVSFALNGRTGVSDETRARILAAARELGWRPSARGRALSTDRAYAVGIVLDRPAYLLTADPFYAPFIAGSESVLGHNGYSLLLRVVDDGWDALRGAYLDLWFAGRIDGFLILDLRSADQRLDELVARGVPMIAVGAPDRDDVPWVAIDDRAGYDDALRHLTDLGHRRIAHVTGPLDYVHAAARRGVWIDALERVGAPPGPQISGDFTAAGGAKATSHLLALGNPCTAIAYANDLMALAGMQVLRAAGISVPGDVSVIGFDDIVTAGLSVPTLTTVSQNALEWGASAARSLLALLDDTPADLGWFGDSELILRGSTGPPPDIAAT